MGSSLFLKTASGYHSPGADLGSDGTALRQPGKRPSMERLPNKGGSMSRKSRAAGSSPGVPIWLMQDQGQMHPFRPAGNVTISGV